MRNFYLYFFIIIQISLSLNIYASHPSMSQPWNRSCMAKDPYSGNPGNGIAKDGHIYNCLANNSNMVNLSPFPGIDLRINLATDLLSPTGYANPSISSSPPTMPPTNYTQVYTNRAPGAACVIPPKDNSYFNPQIIVKSRTCVAGFCTCDWIKLSANGDCDWLLIGPIPFRICSRTVEAYQSIKTSLSTIAPIFSYTNNSNYKQICAFNDPCDPGDTSGCVPFSKGKSPYHYSFPKNMLVLDGTTNYTRPLPSPIGLPVTFIGGLLTQSLAKLSRGLSSGSFIAQVLSAQLALSAGLMTAFSIISSGNDAVGSIATLPGFNSQLGNPTGNSNSLFFVPGMQVNGLPIGCINFPAAPPPPPYAQTIIPKSVQATAEQVCYNGQSPSLTNACVSTKPNFNPFGVNFNSFEQSLIRVGINYNVPLCKNTSDSRCIAIYNATNSSISGSDLKTSIVANADKAYIFQCGDANAPANGECFKLITSAPNSLTLNQGSQYRLLYSYDSQPTPTNYYGNTGTLYGVNIGPFYDLGLQYINAFSPPSGGEFSSTTFNLYNMSDAVIPNTARAVTVYSAVSNSLPAPGQNLASSRAKLLSMTYPNTTSGYFFAYIDPENPNVISAYQAPTDGNQNSDAIPIGDVQRAPITDISISGPSSARVSDGAHTTPRLQVNIGKSPNTISQNNIGIVCNPFWVTNCGDTIVNKPIYVHGINVNKVILAQKVKIGYRNNDISTLSCYNTTYGIIPPSPFTYYEDYISSNLNSTYFRNLSDTRASKIYTAQAIQNSCSSNNNSNCECSNCLTYNNAGTSLINSFLSNGCYHQDASGIYYQDSNIYGKGYLGGLEFGNLSSNKEDDASILGPSGFTTTLTAPTSKTYSYYRGADVICLDTNSFASLIQKQDNNGMMLNVSVLSKAVPCDNSVGISGSSTSNCPSTFQYNSLYPLPSANSNLPSYLTGSFYTNYETSNGVTISSGSQICYPSRILPACISAGSCCNSCISGNCTGDRIRTSADLSYQINNNTEMIRNLLPWEAQTLSSTGSAISNFCLQVPPPTPCSNISTASADDGYAIWGPSNSGSINVQGTCISGYQPTISNGSPVQPTRTCYPVGDTGKWGPVSNPCSIITCPSITTGSSDSGYATWPQAIHGSSNVQGTCILGYEPDSVNPTRNCGSDGTWQIVTKPCKIKYCSSIPDYDNLVTWPQTAPGSTARVTCKGGIGTLTRSCGRDGTWSATVTETQTCACGSMDIDVGNGYTLNISSNASTGNSSRTTCSGYYLQQPYYRANPRYNVVNSENVTCSGRTGWDLSSNNCGKHQNCEGGDVNGNLNNSLIYCSEGDCDHQVYAHCSGLHRLNYKTGDIIDCRVVYDDQDRGGTKMKCLENGWSSYYACSVSQDSFTFDSNPSKNICCNCNRFPCYNQDWTSWYVDLGATLGATVVIQGKGSSNNTVNGNDSYCRR